MRSTCSVLLSSSSEPTGAGASVSSQSRAISIAGTANVTNKPGPSSLGKATMTGVTCAVEVGQSSNRTGHSLAASSFTSVTNPAFARSQKPTVDAPLRRPAREPFGAENAGSRRRGDPISRHASTADDCAGDDRPLPSGWLVTHAGLDAAVGACAVVACAVDQLRCRRASRSRSSSSLDRGPSDLANLMSASQVSGRTADARLTPTHTRPPTRVNAQERWLGSTEVPIGAARRVGLVNVRCARYALSPGCASRHP